MEPDDTKGRWVYDPETQSYVDTSTGYTVSAAQIAVGGTGGQSMATTAARGRAGTYAEEWSVVQVSLRDGSRMAYNINAGPGITEHLVQQMRDTGFLRLRNTDSAIVLAADQVRGFTIQKLTQ